jgi:hypothetical protein
MWQQGRIKKKKTKIIKTITDTGAPMKRNIHRFYYEITGFENGSHKRYDYY